ncbi:hypothetical protein H1D32_13435 [Anaerobacillus sp. CMMVII]|uniref:hypothetical protein n=1 Tax=Anaerobacillus sp. CMMVII TaxID=2755588 RepID=UPI0021B765B1|nr:hypothetical protein [Anaerobacillus sp. CMMVII]MCT8138657.1 hypothetical protein [Anaerobacillus sp. CMMVII]
MFIVKIIFIVSSLILLLGCSKSVNYDFYLDDAIDFYVLMLQNGEQTEELDKVYEDFQKYNRLDDPLFINVLKMYEAFSNDAEDVEIYRYEVTRLINE